MHPTYSFSMQYIKPPNMLCRYISWLLKQMLIGRCEFFFGFSNIQSFRILGILKLTKGQYVSKYNISTDENGYRHLKIL